MPKIKKKRPCLSVPEVIVVLFLRTSEIKNLQELVERVASFTDCQTLTRSAVYQLMKRLQEEGLIREEVFARAKVRPGLRYQLTELGMEKASKYEKDLLTLLGITRIT